MVGWIIRFGYLLEVLLGWSASFRELVWDWRLEQWQLCWADLPALLLGRHRLLCSADTALYELTTAGARELSGRFDVLAHVYYVSLPCQITRASGGRALPSSDASPLMVLSAALMDLLGAVGNDSNALSHSDGLVPTACQRHPPTQPHRHAPELNEASAAELAACLAPGVWLYADPSSVEHGRAWGTGSPALELSVASVLPALCLAARACEACNSSGAAAASAASAASSGAAAASAASAASAAVAGGASASAASAADQPLVVQLLCTNDTHSQMVPFVPSQGSEAGREVGPLAG